MLRRSLRVGRAAGEAGTFEPVDNPGNRAGCQPGRLGQLAGGGDAHLAKHAQYALVRGGDAELSGDRLMERHHRGCQLAMESVGGSEGCRRLLKLS